MGTRYRLVISKQADRDLLKMHPQDKKRILKWMHKNIEGALDPKVLPQAKKLSNWEGNMYRYKVGRNFRIVVRLEDNEAIVLVLYVGTRQAIQKIYNRGFQIKVSLPFQQLAYFLCLVCVILNSTPIRKYRQGVPIMKTIKLKQLATNRILKGYPALEEYDFADKSNAKEGDLVELKGPNNQFVAYGYLGNEKKTAGWVLSLDQDEEINTTFYDRLFRIARDNRRAFYADDQTTAFRFFNGDGDSLGGLTIEYYEGFYVFTWYSHGIYQYRDQILQAFKVAIPDFKGIYEKNNFKGAEVKSQHVDGEKAPEPLIIKENGIRYATYLNEGWMTGIFLDQRTVRRRIMNDFGVGRTVLNTFSYTGAFSIAAAMGGAMKTVNVDAANRSQEKTKEQFEINGLDPDDHEIRVIDIFSYLDYAKKHNLQFDLIVLDPPTFARTKERTFSVEEDYPELVQEALEVLTPKGILIASTNMWKLSHEDFYELVSEGFDAAGVDGYLLEEHGLPEDFRTNEEYPESQYLKVLVLEKSVADGFKQ